MIVQLARRVIPRFDSRIEIGIPTYVLRPYANVPLFVDWVPCDPENSAGSLTLPYRRVFAVLNPADIAKVREPVIPPVSVDMVYFVGYFAMSDKPSHTVRGVNGTQNFPVQVSSMVLNV